MNTADDFQEDENTSLNLQTVDIRRFIKHADDLATALEHSAEVINPAATTQAMLATITHLTAGDITMPNSEKCAAWFGNYVYNSIDLEYLNIGVPQVINTLLVARHEGKDSTWGTTVTSEIFSSKVNVTDHFSETGVNQLMWIPPSVSNMMRRQSYQQKGSDEAALVTAMEIHKAKLYKFKGDKGKWVRLNDPHLTALFTFTHSDMVFFSNRSNTGNPMLASILTAPIDNNTFLDNEHFGQGMAALQRLANHYQANFANGGLIAAREQRATAIELMFITDPKSCRFILNIATNEHPAFGHFVRAHYKLVKYIACSIARWNGETQVSEELMIAVCWYVANCLRSQADKMIILDRDSSGDVYAAIIETVKMHNDKGITESKLIENCAALRKVEKGEDRDRWLARVMQDGKIKLVVKESGKDGGRPYSRFFLANK